MQSHSSLIDEARRYDAKARGHKRGITAHRNALKECRRKQAEIEAACARLGIKVTYQTGEGNSHGHGKQRSTS